MALEKQEARKIYLTLSNGRIVRQHQNAIEGVTVARENKNGKTVHEEFFSSLTALITNIRSKDTDFGKVWEIEMKDGDDDFLISFNYSSRYANNFFRALENVDLSMPVKFAPWSMKDKQDPTRLVIGLSLYQLGTKIEFKYTKDHPGDMPQMEQVKRKGKLEWDDTKQLEFFEEILSRLSFASTKMQPVAVGATEEDNSEPLPF
jgi:hypothetical protein